MGSRLFAGLHTGPVPPGVGPSPTPTVAGAGPDPAVPTAEPVSHVSLLLSPGPLEHDSTTGRIPLYAGFSGLRCGAEKTVFG